RVRVTAGAQFSFAIFGFIPDVNELIVLDWARVSGGAGDVNYGICGFVPASGRSLPYLPEKIATAIAGAGDPPSGDVKRPHLVSLQCHGGATAGALGGGGDSKDHRARY